MVSPANTTPLGVWIDGRPVLSIAYGSAMELETQLILAKRLSFGKINAYEKVELLLGDVIRMLNKMSVNKTSD